MYTNTILINLMGEELKRKETVTCGDMLMLC